jgi:formamidopyrimidine-DNA glycosylase
MPELPEVETVRRSLEMALPDRIFVEIQVRQPRLRFTVDE